MVWAALCLVLEIVVKIVIKNRNSFIFQHSNDPKHTARAVKVYLD